MTNETTTLDRTADDWSLFDILGRDDVARLLNESVSQAVDARDYGIIDRRLEALSEWGANDSEGRNLASKLWRQALADGRVPGADQAATVRFDDAVTTLMSYAYDHGQTYFAHIGFDMPARWMANAIAIAFDLSPTGDECKALRESLETEFVRGREDR